MNALFQIEASRSADTGYAMLEAATSGVNSSEQLRFNSESASRSTQFVRHEVNEDPLPVDDEPTGVVPENSINIEGENAVREEESK